MRAPHNGACARLRPQVGMGGMECYEQDFEEYLLADTSAYYKVKAAAWIEQDSCPDYMQKADDCLQKEEERVENYLHSSTKVRICGGGRVLCGSSTR